MITYGNNKISVEEYNNLRNSVNWDSLMFEVAKQIIHNSVCFVALDKNLPIGFARLISDGGYANMLLDVMVKPRYQNCGIGTNLIKNAIKYVKDNLISGERQVVCAFSAIDMEKFYRKFDFIKRPTEKLGAGMSMLISNDKEIEKI